MKAVKKVKKGCFGVKNGSDTLIMTGFSSVHDAVMSANTYLWENELFYVLFTIVDHTGFEVETISVEPSARFFQD